MDELSKLIEKGPWARVYVANILPGTSQSVTKKIHNAENVSHGVLSSYSHILRLTWISPLPPEVNPFHGMQRQSGSLKGFLPVIYFCMDIVSDKPT